MLAKIFTDVVDDPEWESESAIFELYENRIPILELLSLLTSDSKWAHVADKGQYEKILGLFNKVYGYKQGLSRIQEIQKRYREKKMVISKQKQTKEKSFLTHLFDTMKFIDDRDMVNRYSQHLDNLLINSQPPWMVSRHKLFEAYVGETKDQEMSWYERMVIDKMLRDKAQTNNNNTSNG